MNLNLCLRGDASSLHPNRECAVIPMFDFGGMSASLIDRVGRPELMLIKVRNVGSLGNESSESVDIGVLKGKIKEIKMKNKQRKCEITYLHVPGIGPTYHLLPT